MSVDFLYTPINTIKALADDVWLVDGPEIRFGLGPFKVPFSTRMTLIRLPDGDLVVHSPTALTNELKAEVDALGPVSAIVAPNKIHYWWVRDWKEAYPDARVLSAPGVEERAKVRLPTVDFVMDGADVPGWGEGLSYIPITSGFMTEVVLFHHPSKTLVLTDLIENFEPQRIKFPPWRWVLRLAGILHPHGSMPRDMRLTFRGREEHLRQAVCRMMDWRPQRIVLAHGKIYEADCRAELARAFRFADVGD